MDDNGLRFSCGNVFPHCRFSLLGGVVVLIAEHVLFPFHGGVENPVLGSFLCFLCLVVKVCPLNFNTMIIGPHFFIPLKSQWITILQKKTHSFGESRANPEEIIFFSF